MLVELEKELEALTAKRARLDSRVWDLQQETDAAQQDLVDISTKALKACLNRDQVQAAAEELDDYVQIARSLMTPDVDAWREAPRLFIGKVLAKIRAWAGTEGQDLEATIPPAIARSTIFIVSGASLRLSYLLDWVIAGVLDEIERKAFSGE